MNSVQAHSTTVLTTPRLSLRFPEASDLPAIVAGLGDLRVARMLARVPHPYRKADAEAFLEAAAEQNAAGTHLHLFIEEGGRIVGGIGLHGLPVPEDFGYWLAPEAWGRGIATEAADALLGYAFEKLDVVRVPSGVFIDNPASLRVQDKLGFTRTGISRKFSVARGADIDHIDTVLMRERFEAFRR